MTPEEKEAFYDEKIAPELARLGALCEDNGLPFVASVEFDSENQGQGMTFVLPKDASASMRTIRMLMLSKGNIDKFLFSVIRYIRESGIDHSSIFLMPHIPCEAKKRKAEEPKIEMPPSDGKQVRIAFID